MLTPEDKREMEKIIESKVRDSFSRKIGDTPTDNLQLVNRAYVNLYGSVLGRPISSVVGQQYFDTAIGRPIFRRGDGAWVDGAGSVS